MTPDEARKLINDYRMRCVRAADLRRAGDTAGADAIDPTDDELREGLLALRNAREVETAATAEKKRKRAEAKIPLDLNDLFADVKTEEKK